MKPQKLIIWALSLVTILLAISTVCQAQELTKVDANEILEQIKNGEDVKIENSFVTGFLNLTEIDIVESEIRIENSIFKNDVDFSSTYFRKPLSFNGTNFSGKTSFGDVTFSSYANFVEATFSGYANFSGVTFNDYTYFTGVTFGDDVNFREAIFSDYTNFVEATFSGNADFTLATFSGSTHFRFVTFSSDAYFTFATFSSDAYFWHTIFSSDAHFGRMTFGGNAGFMGATFRGNADFGEAIFSNDADFTRATFRGNADFGEAIFNDFTYFTFATFRGNADFRKATFVGDAVMEVSWSILKDALVFDGPTYIKLIQNFRATEQFDDADAAYYQYRQISQANKKVSISKLSDVFMWATCGYGVKPYRTLICGGVIVLLFSLVYWRGDGISRLKENNTDDNQRTSFWDAFYFSMVTFTTVGYGDWYPKDRYRKYVMIEGLFGWLLLALFLVTLARVMIRP